MKIVLVILFLEMCSYCSAKCGEQSLWKITYQRTALQMSFISFLNCSHILKISGQCTTLQIQYTTFSSNLLSPIVFNSVKAHEINFICLNTFSRQVSISKIRMETMIISDMIGIEPSERAYLIAPSSPSLLTLGKKESFGNYWATHISGPKKIWFA